jgi:hypothetical protein
MINREKDRTLSTVFEKIVGRDYSTLRESIVYKNPIFYHGEIYVFELVEFNRKKIFGYNFILNNYWEPLKKKIIFMDDLLDIVFPPEGSVVLLNESGEK